MINLLYLIPLFEAAPAPSIDSSAPATQDFSALLTELAGGGVGAVEVQVAEPTAQAPAGFFLETSQLARSGPTVGAVYDRASLVTMRENVELAAKIAQSQTVPTVNVVVPEAAFRASRQTLAACAVSVTLKGLLENIGNHPNSQEEMAGDPAIASPSPDSILEDVKKFEITIQREAIKPAVIQAPPQKPGPLGGENVHKIVKVSGAMEQAAQGQRQGKVPSHVPSAPLTLWPLTRQPQPVPGVIATERVSIAGKQQDRKDELEMIGPNDSPEPVLMFQPLDPRRTLGTIEQPHPPPYSEIPQVPKLQIVRTVSMEVGEADSQIIVRIEDRGGGMNVHLGAENDITHRALASSIDTLVHALKREKIELSNLEVTRKSPIEKVRRTKEAN